jgi:hypothetical protein
MSAEQIAAALGGRRSGAGWVARCPAHDNRAPSLSIRTGHERKALLHCFAGCPYDAIVAALDSQRLAFPVLMIEIRTTAKV